MPLTVYTFEAPAHWASALINGDCSSFDDAEQAEFDAWCAAHPAECAEVVDCGEESWFGRFNGLGTDLLTYNALSREARS